MPENNIRPRAHNNYLGHSMISYLRGDKTINMDKKRRLTEAEKEFIKKVKLALKK